MTAAARSLEPGKEPRQERSRRMRTGILEAAARVLRDEGALELTTVRVAGEAGVSIGSLYQYFPNKYALVVALHRDAVRRGREHVQRILDDPAGRARDKVAEVARWFFSTECSDVSELGAASEDVRMFLRDCHPDQVDHDVQDLFLRFLAASSVRRPPAEARFAARLLATTLEALGQVVATRPLGRVERDRWAVAVTTMLCDHLGIGDAPS
ncbi:MAG: TetR/AcrR family transcriptional regulator [Acidimicrobiales bacterium]